MTLLELRHWIRFSSATLLVFIVSALGQAHSQSSQNPDLQQLKDKLQHLDEQMQELKEQIQSAEDKLSRGQVRRPIRRHRFKARPKSASNGAAGRRR